MNALYRTFQHKLVGLTLSVALAPLLLLGGTIYVQFAGMYGDKIEEQIRYRAASQAEAVDLFLKERTAVLCGMADTLDLEKVLDPKTLRNILDVMNARAGAFVDLGVIDSSGRHLTYVGPYTLSGLNYANQQWFAEVSSKGVYVSDVFMGYRQIPHFIIAVARREGGGQWILRATIDPDVFGALVKAAQVGKTGDAYIVNQSGQYQTRPRYDGEAMGESGLDTSLFGGRTSTVELRNRQGKRRLYAGSWLKNHNWLLVISQDVDEEMSGLFATRRVAVFIIGFGILAIVLTTVLTTRQTVRRLQDQENKMNVLNAQLIQSDKLAALGKLAAGVAHEINNPLAVILQKTGWMEDLLADEEFKNSPNAEEFRTSLHKIEEHVERARKIVHGMLGYARKMEPRLEDVDINQVLRQTLGLLDTYARSNTIHVEENLSETIPVIASNQAELQQVFLNLLTNAMDAIGKGGIIRVESGAKGDRILVSIRDNGPGISEENRRRVFDPFFTTKGAGKGTGLGLWISYTIVEKLGGRIGVESEEGKGSCFTVEIPLVLPEKK